MGTSGEGEATGGRAVSTQREVVLGTQQATPKVGWFVSSGAEPPPHAVSGTVRGSAPFPALRARRQQTSIESLRRPDAMA